MSFWQKLRGLLPSYRAAQERDMQEELESLKAMARPGELGNLTRAAEDARAVWGWRLIDRLEQDLRHALRFTLAAFRREFSLSVVTMLTLAFALAANTTIFSLINAILFKELPAVARQEELVDIRRELNNRIQDSFSYVSFLAQRDLHMDVVSGLAAYELPNGVGVRVAGGTTEVMSAATVSGNFFDVLETKPSLGRLISEMDNAGAAPVAVINHRLWRTRFGSLPTVLGSVVTINRRTFTIVGVAPEGFEGVSRVDRTDLWIPLATHPDPVRLNTPSWSWLKFIGRLQGRLTIQQAQIALDARVTERGRLVLSSHNGRSEREIYTSTLLMAVPIAVLLIASANVAGIGIARAAARKREVAVRLALGATRRRVFLQVLSEILPLFVAASAFGALLVPLLKRLMEWIDPVEAVIDSSPDLRVIGFTIAITAVAAILAGLSPAIHATKAALALSLKDDSINSTYRRLRLRNTLVVGQIAVSVVLLVTGGLFLQTLRHAWKLDPGFDADNIRVVALNPAGGGLQENEAQVFGLELLRRALRVPGIESAGLSRDVPSDGGDSRYGVKVPGHHTPGPEMGTPIPYNGVTPGYFQSMSIPLLKGRDFTDADRKDAPKVAIVSASVARRFWPGQDPIGRRYYESREMTEQTAIEVVGVVGDTVSEHFLDGEVPLFVYKPFEQWYGSGSLFLLYRSANVDSIVPALRRAAADINPNVPVVYARSMREVLGRDLALQRWLAWIVSTMGGLGLTLASLGIYGVTSHAVASRTREIGIRTSLGADPGTIVRLMLREGCVVTMAGLILGYLTALAVTRLVAAALYGVTPTDPLTFTLASTVVVFVVFVACYVPARRASRADPMAALRLE